MSVTQSQSQSQWKYRDANGVRPPLLRKRDLLALFLKPSVVAALCRTAWLSDNPDHPECHGWLRLAGEPTRGGDLVYTTESVEQAMTRYLAGDRIPPLPAREKEKRRRLLTEITAKLSAEVAS